MIINVHILTGAQHVTMVILYCSTKGEVQPQCCCEATKVVMMLPWKPLILCYHREEITQHQAELRQHKASSQQKMQQLVLFLISGCHGI